MLLDSEKEAEEKKKILQDDFDIAMTKTLESEVSAMCNLSKGVEERGIAIGLERGIEITTINAIRNVLWHLMFRLKSFLRVYSYIPDKGEKTNEKLKMNGLIYSEKRLKRICHLQ